MCEMELFIPWKLISVQEMLFDMGEQVWIDSTRFTSSHVQGTEFQLLAEYNVQTLADMNSTNRKKLVMCPSTHWVWVKFQLCYNPE